MGLCCSFAKNVAIGGNQAKYTSDPSELLLTNVCESTIISIVSLPLKKFKFSSLGSDRRSGQTGRVLCKINSRKIKKSKEDQRRHLAATEHPKLKGSETD